jgi:glucosamine--fructose-6-phosphate aminotransferase (isomerizing)
MDSNNITNPMCRQAWSIPQLIREQYAILEPKTRSLLSTPEIFSIQRILLTGCGDSYAAALSMKHIFELLTEIPTEVVEPLDLARYYHPKQVGFAPNNPIVFAISNSGAVSRVAEAVRFVNEHGGFTVGITSNPDSPLGTSRKRLLQLQISPFESAPGVRSYLFRCCRCCFLPFEFRRYADALRWTWRTSTGRIF